MYAHRRFSRVLILALSLLFLQEGATAQQARSAFAIGDSSFLLNQKPFVIRCGEMHYTRMPRAYWRHRLKMAKAMGLNTVCAYLFWNFTEREPGNFNWSGQADAAEFCRIAQQEGLYVILRPGPYSCAEWEFGGFPWWLLKDKAMQVRTQNAHYLEACKRYLMEVGKQLAPLQVDKGGNILMVQVENEYGSFGSDREYIGKIRDFLKEAGFTVPFFTCDGPVQLKNDVRPDIFAAVNFGGNPEAGFKALRTVQAHGPLMCAEYYPGWFDSWGRPHHTGSSQRVIDELKWMLDHQASFSIYMAHGGTTFGTFSGANAPPYLPQTSSYDYDAPINEAGNATSKFYAIRELLGKYLQPGETLPDVPEATEARSLSPIRFTATAPLWNNLPPAVAADTAMLMEDLDQGYGAVLYETLLPAGGTASVQFADIHDYAIVYLNKKQVGTMDRRKGNFTLNIPARAKATPLQILVEATGRVNYGYLMHDRKGIHGKVILDDGKTKKELKGWKNYPIGLGDKTLPVTYTALSKAGQPGAAFYKATFEVNELKDTYLDLRKWNKGLVWVNGICLGRYWNIGPTQTMYLPGCWLKKGTNEIVVFDLLGLARPELHGLDKPIPDSVTEKRAQAHKKASQKWTAPASGAYHSGAFEDSKEWQTVSFKPVTARYFCLEALNEFKNQPYTSAAEIQLLDADGKEIPRSAWKVMFADSEEVDGDDGNAANLFDLQFTSIWHTEWQDRSPKHPHQVVIDLGKAYKVAGLKLLPRQDNPNGRIKDYRLYFSATPFKGL
ncbi:beta-galactosidase [Niabella drilacis]|uniref:Beta-galactosidase n=1 Tax=Niabella drilacis (strain DSM 25811 / CCM 8410 / CCUG 62505 / LMG 26954 / E90) TaxID=1285928 RepID=A0A1G6W5Q1_NIADE|nr:beta-galactosidase [Niabella drilacis]SDD61260.1 beta-galactosidase [Niabella drilacis]